MVHNARLKEAHEIILMRDTQITKLKAELVVAQTQLPAM